MNVSNGALAAASGGVSAICLAEIDVLAVAEGTYNNTIVTGGVTGTVGGGPALTRLPMPHCKVRSPATIAKAFSPHLFRPGRRQP